MLKENNQLSFCLSSYASLYDILIEKNNFWRQLKDMVDFSFVYDELKEKNYVNVNGYIFEEYSKAAEILRAKGTSKVSVEIAIEDMSWNADEDCLNINSFYFIIINAFLRHFYKYCVYLHYIIITILITLLDIESYES